MTLGSCERCKHSEGRLVPAVGVATSPHGSGAIAFVVCLSCAIALAVPPKAGGSGYRTHLVTPLGAWQ